ncbi:hypothetical protein BRD17_03580 [Halobacteriales archaeon SW_7_68_16]|nr:MAG: hypothetical protein BRD17_03580 [Halobacteriales archaeon SW_7_68_16]
MTTGAFTDPKPYATDYYDRLGVPADADTDAIEEHYRTHAASMHPDVSDHDDPSEAFTRFEDAKNALTDDSRREAYNTFRDRRDVDDPVRAFEAWNARGQPESPGMFSLERGTANGSSQGATGGSGTGAGDADTGAGTGTGGPVPGPGPGGAGGTGPGAGPGGRNAGELPLPMKRQRLYQLLSSLQSTQQYLHGWLQQSLTRQQVELATAQYETYDQQLDRAMDLFEGIRADLPVQERKQLQQTLRGLITARSELVSLLAQHDVQHGTGTDDTAGGRSSANSGGTAGGTGGRSEPNAGRSRTGGDTGSRTGTGGSSESEVETSTGPSRATAREASMETATNGWYRVGFLIAGMFLAPAGYGMVTEVVLGGTAPGGVVRSWLVGGLVSWYVTSKWTSAVDDTPAPEAVYERLSVRPSRVAGAVVIGLTIQLLVLLLPVPSLADTLLTQGSGVVVIGSVLAYGLAQIYHVTLGRIDG